MKQIPLTQGKFASVDDEDFGYLSTFKWYALKSRYTFYAVANVKVDGIWTKVRMHRVILAADLVDHADKDGLNNQRYNLRAATPSQNMLNAKLSERGTSVYHGVRLKNNRWTAQVSKDGKNKHIGYFKTELEAAQAYNAAAIELHGEFANINEL